MHHHGKEKKNPKSRQSRIDEQVSSRLRLRLSGAGELDIRVPGQLQVAELRFGLSDELVYGTTLDAAGDRLNAARALVQDDVAAGRVIDVRELAERDIIPIWA